MRDDRIEGAWRALAQDRDASQQAHRPLGEIGDLAQHVGATDAEEIRDEVRVRLREVAQDALGTRAVAGRGKTRRLMSSWPAGSASS